MAVNEHLSAYSTTAGSNTPAGSDPIGTDLDNHLRDIKRNVRYASNTPVQAAKTQGYTVTASDHASLIQVDASATTVVVTLLAAASAGDGFRLGVKLTKGTKCVIDANGSETIDGTLTASISVLNRTLELACDGSNWVVSGGHDEIGNLMTTQGDIIVEGASGAERLAVGAAGTSLVGGTDPSWVAGAEQFLEYADLTNGGADDLAIYEFTHDMQDGYKYIVRARDVSINAAAGYPYLTVKNDAGTELTGATDYGISTNVPTVAGFINQDSGSILPFSYPSWPNAASTQSFNWDMVVEGAMDTAVVTVLRGTTTVYDNAGSVDSGCAFTGHLQTIDGHENIIIKASGGNFHGGEVWLSRIKEGS